MRLIRLPGDPANPPLAHSLAMLGAVLADTEAEERASSRGDVAWFALFGTGKGRVSGVLLAGGDDASDSRRLCDEFPLALIPIFEAGCIAAGALLSSAFVAEL